jgi:hypothetical protein
LSELNQIIAEQQGVSVQDLAIKPNAKQNVEIQELAQIKEMPAESAVDDPGRTTSTNVNQVMEPMDDAALAKKYRSDADRLAKEAANLRRMAEELVPTKKKQTVKE